MVLAAVFDLPAKAAVLNTIQFNGYYGCIYCKDRGEAATSHQHVNPPTATHEVHKEKDMLKWAREAESSGKTVYGVKGLSVHSNIVNIPYGVPIDYMHSVLEGVVKTLLSYWFKRSNVPYSLKQYIGAIDKEMLQIRPPHKFRRSPRALESFPYWKVSEYRVLLLFHAVPLLKQYLPPDYILHLSLLVFAIHRLLSTTVQSAKLSVIQDVLKLFYDLVPQLYDLTMCNANVHSLCHLVTMVQNWGPPWGYSAFGFENVNGVLKQQIHGTQQVLYQAVSSMKLRKIISFAKENNQSQSSVIIGKLHKTVVPDEFSELIGSFSVLAFYRAKIGSIVYDSRKHKRKGSARISSIISFYQNESLCFGYILFFYLI
uniref:DUF4218 domain-containing protein n=1 Tax=Amphimedon queenslandica TaxID=400682 RepID=A0A1X7T064_AMPQE